LQIKERADTGKEIATDRLEPLCSVQETVDYKVYVLLFYIKKQP
jgi:hypothetical protein